LISYLAIGFYQQSCESSPQNDEQICVNEKLWRENAKLRQAQAKLKASESRLNSILSSMADLVFVLDSEGRFIFHHSPRIDGLYMPPEAFLGKTHLEVMPSRIQTPFAEAMEKNRCGEITQYEYWLEIDGETRWFSVIMSPIILDGDFAGSVAVARETTEIKTMQWELQQAHETLERQAESRMARLKILREIDQAILMVRPPRIIAEVALHHIRRLVPCLGGVVLLFDVDAGVMTVLVAEFGHTSAVQEEIRVPLSVLAGRDRVLESLWRMESHILEDTYAVLEPSRAIQTLQTWGVRSLLSIPLVVEGETIGTLCLGAEHPGHFTRESIDIASEIAGSLAVAIQQSRLMEQMSTSRLRLRQLTQQLISTQEEERRRLARALHDEAGQALIALEISLGLLQEDLPAELGSLHQRLSNAIALTTNTMEHLRSLAHDLRPPTLDAAGLKPALQGFCDEFSKHTQLRITYTSPELFPELSDAANICLYRFLQEALTNVAKHAGANRVDIALRYDSDKVYLAIADDGCGFDEQARLSSPSWSMGIGLLGMQERLESFGGRLEIESQVGQGTCLTACLPVSGIRLEESR
jgi:PAS domain S-box-containing protein